MPRPSPEEQIEFLVKIQRLFSEDSFVATYKFALLQALADLSVEKGDYSGDTLRISTREIAEKFIQYYWRQTLPLVSPVGQETSVLRQNTGRQAAVINLVAGSRQEYDGSLSRAKLNHRKWNSLINVPGCATSEALEAMKESWGNQLISGNFSSVRSAKASTYIVHS